MILDALHRVSHKRWGDVLSFIESLPSVDEPSGEAGPRPMNADDLLASGLVGRGSDRTDIGDSREFARRLRERA